MFLFEQFQIALTHTAEVNDNISHHFLGTKLCLSQYIEYQALANIFHFYL